MDLTPIIPTLCNWLHNRDKHSHHCTSKNMARPRDKRHPSLSCRCQGGETEPGNPKLPPGRAVKPVHTQGPYPSTVPGRFLKLLVFSKLLNGSNTYRSAQIIIAHVTNFHKVQHTWSSSSEHQFPGSPWAPTISPSPEVSTS